MANVTPPGAGVSGPVVIVGGTPVGNGTDGYILYNNNGVVGNIAPGSVSANLVVASTAITGGATGRVLYDNGGVLGEMTTTGSGTVLALATSPVLVTPTLGVAAGTSLALGGAVIGSNALSVTGSMLLTGALTTTGNMLIANNSFTITGSLAQTYNSGLFSFSSSGSANGTADTGISRISGGVIGIGTGAQGSVAGTVQALNFSSGSATAILTSRVTITGGGTGNVPTLTAGPVTGNPTKWLPYNDNGTTRYIPSW